MLKNLLAPFLKSSSKATLVGPRLGATEAQALTYVEGLILIDGARSAFEKKPPSSLLVGDGDSCRPEVLSEFDFLCDPNKSESDLALLLESLPQTVKELTLFGFRGGRLDHELFNLGELSYWLAKAPDRKLSHGEDLEGRSSGEWDFEFEGLFSLLTLQECQFTMTGDIEYPLKAQTVAALKSLTLSNRSAGAFTIHSSKPFFLYRNLPELH